VVVPAAPDVGAQADVVAALEETFRRDIASQLRTAEGGLPPDQLFRWSEDLRDIDAHVRSLDHWDQIESQRVLPRLVQVLQALDRGLGGPLAPVWHTWRGEYLPELHKLLEACRRRAALRSEEATARISTAVGALLPPERRGESLSRRAVWVAASTPGVTTVLVGMRRPEYVDDALAVMDWPPLAGAAEVYEAVARTNE
jgi:hypothetical protein